ncbi:MAG: membrane protein insertion efficiency factor YidD [Chloroflexi bacterium]|nr:membrane protein insertion efficiency factor YidD [Chloroflexota bacterium]MBI4197878.1 membrane protein insertion efficiency factor YidD [Chloroflexota bacterium]
MTWTLLGLIRLYQKALSPFWPASCRYYPTCSHYAAEAVARFGPWKGGWLALRRLGRCQPWGAMGYDPVPGGGPSPTHDSP